MPADRKEHWIPVQTSNGMFSSEYAVMLETADGSPVSFFIDKNLVKEEKGNAQLKVVLVGSKPSENRELVMLPTETFETSSRWVEIKAA